MNQLRRSIVLAGTAALTLPFGGKAQQSKPRMPQVGFLGAASATGFARHIAGLRAGLRELGYLEGNNLAIEFRWAEGRLDKLPGLASELVRLKVDVLVTQGTPATRAAKETTTAIPIVMAAVGDPVTMGIVPSLARPSGNITGLTFFAAELAAKRLELLKDAVPRATRVALLFNPDNPIQRGPVLEAVVTAAASLKLGFEQIAARSPREFESALSSVAARGVDAVMLIEEPMQIVNAKALVDLAMKHRLIPFGSVEFASAGSVIGYGVNFPDLYRRAAFFVDKILKGAKPSDLPIERATKFELVVNLKAAKTLGIEIPKAILFRADEVIQ